MTGCYTHHSSCNQLNGTWKGFVSDKRGLFDTNNTPITLHIKYKNKHFYGMSKVANPALAHALNRSFNGICTNGKLSKVYLENAFKCGHFAQQGNIRRNNLTIYLPYENAMTGTDFMVIAKKVDDTKIKIKLTRTPENLKTCH